MWSTMVEVEVVMVEPVVVMDILALFPILLRMLPKFSSSHNVCCRFSGKCTVLS